MKFKISVLVKITYFLVKITERAKEGLARGEGRANGLSRLALVKGPKGKSFSSFRKKKIKINILINIIIYKEVMGAVIFRIV